MGPTGGSSRRDGDGHRRLRRRPQVVVHPVVRTAAGTELRVPVVVVNTADVPMVLAVSALGLDPGWVGPPVLTPTLAPGARGDVVLTLHPPQGTLPAAYPVAITAQALEPAGATPVAGSLPGMAETSLVVNPRAQLGIELEPSDLTAVSSRRFSVVLTNAGPVPTTVQLRAGRSAVGRIGLRKAGVTVPAEGRVTVPARARIHRPRLAGHGSRAGFTITATSVESVQHAQGTLRQRAVLGPWALKAGILVAVLAVWLAAGVAFIPPLVEKMTGTETAETASAPTDAEAEGAGEDGAGGGEDAAAGEEAAPGSEPAEAEVTDGSPGEAQISGTVTGTAPQGVAVRLEPTSLVDEEAQGGIGVGVDTDALDGTGLRPAAAFTSAAPARAEPDRGTTTADDGSFAFASVASPGYYLLTLSKPGYQTQRYVVDSASKAAEEPLEVDLQAGSGALQGHLSGPDGSVGGATVTISDGTNTLTTSSDSRTGDWSVDGLSTPATYVVQASRHNLSTEARQVVLPAGGSATADLTMAKGVATFGGTIMAMTRNGDPGGLGGATVTVSDGEGAARTATTLTAAPRGFFTVPGLPTPGQYTVSIAAPGYQSETRELNLRRGQSRVRIDPVTLVSATGSITGSVSQTPLGKPDGEATARPATGLTLRNADHSYKTTSSSSTSDSTYSFTGVTPGVYTLTAEYFGYTKTDTVVRVRAGDAATRDITLAPLRDGTIPFTSSVTGLVVDSTTGRALASCDATRVVGQDGCVQVVVDDDRDGDADQATYVDTIPQSDPGASYTVPRTPSSCATTAGPECGLIPGLHAVLVTAPGYLPQRVTVAVGESRKNVAAPLVSLVPVPSVSGTVSLAATTDADGAVETAGKLPQTCVWVQTSGASGNLPDCTKAIAAGRDGATPDPASNADACRPGRSLDPAPRSSRTRWCAAIDTTTGNYLVELPRTGAYTVTVASSDPEYLPASASTQLFLDSGRTDYPVVLDRLGRVELRVRVPSPKVTDGTDPSSDLVAAPGVVVGLQPRSPLPIEPTGPDGITTLTGLTPGSYLVSGGQGEYAGTTAVDVSLNTTTRKRLPLTDPVTGFVGKVTGTDPVLGREVSVAGADVRVEGTAEFGDDDKPSKAAAAEMTTDQSGCFAIQSQPTVVPPTSADCPQGWTDSSRRVSSFASGTMSSVTATATGWRTYTAVKNQRQLATGTLNRIVLKPAGVAPGLTVTTDPPGGSPTVTVAITNTGGRTVTATVDKTTGSLLWDDNTPNDDLPAGQAQPGVYTVTLSAPDYVTATRTVTCAVDTDPLADAGCTSNLPLRLEKLGAVVVTTEDANGNAVNGARVTLIRPGQTEAVAPSVTMDPTTNTSRFGAVEPGSSTATSYTAFKVRAGGFQTGTTQASDTGVVRASCTPAGGAASSQLVLEPGGTTTCVLRLTRLGTVTGTVSARLGAQGGTASETRTPVGATVTATRCTTLAAGGCSALSTDAADRFSAVTTAGGAFTLTGSVDQEGLTKGRYLLRTDVAGFGLRTNGTALAGTPVDVDGATTTTVLDLYATVTDLTVTITDGVDRIADATATLTRSTDGTIQAGDQVAARVSTPSGAAYRFSGVVPGPWYVVVSGAGLTPSYTYKYVETDTAGQSLAVKVGRAQGTLAGTTTVGGTAPGAGTALAGATVTLTCTGTTSAPQAAFCPSGSPTPPALSSTRTKLVAIADAQGRYRLEGVTAGTYLATFRATGYDAVSSATLTFANGTSTTIDQPLAPVLRFLDVTVTPTDPGQPLTKASVTATPLGSTPGTATTRTDLTSAGGVYTAAFGQVRWGCYRIELTLPTGQFGTVTGPTGGASDDAVTCTGGVTVPTTQDAAHVVAGFGVASSALTPTVTATPWPGHPSPTTTLRLQQTSGGSFDQTVTPVSGTALWLPPGDYRVTPVLGGVLAAWWPVTAKTVTLPAAATFDLEETTSTVTVRVDGLTSGEADLQVRPGDGQTGQSPATAATQTANGTATFELPYGRWVIEGSWTGGADQQELDVTDATHTVVLSSPAAAPDPATPDPSTPDPADPVDPDDPSGSTGP